MHDVVVEERLERHTHNKIFSRLNCSISIFDYSLHVFFLNKQAAITIYFPFHFAWKERRKTNAANVKHVLLSFNFTFISLGSGTGSCGIPTFVFTFLMVLFVCKFNNFNFAPSILWPLCSFIFSPHNTHAHSLSYTNFLFYSFCSSLFFVSYIFFSLLCIICSWCAATAILCMRTLHRKIIKFH